MPDHPPSPEDRAKDSRPVILGELLARAAEAEQRRKERGQIEPSPMPADVYDFWRGETSLINPTQNSLDMALAQLGEEFAAGDEQTRARMRTSISMDEFYTLLTFSRRAAVFALRERSVAWVSDGLKAIAMIEAERVDYRDILWALSLLNHSAERIGERTDRLLSDAARLSEPRVARLIDGFVQQSPQGKDLRASWGYDEVETAGGIGFIGWGFGEYHPTYNLKQLALDVADLVGGDKYLPDSVNVATELPKVWLQTKDDDALDAALKCVRAAASVSGRLRPEFSTNAASQMLLIFLMEMANDSIAQTLLDIASKKNTTSYSMVGLAIKRMFCLVVARSYVAGVDAYETTESLGRFSQGLAGIIGRQVGN